jgi:orotate phosphoribosyltransferase
MESVEPAISKEVTRMIFATKAYSVNTENPFIYTSRKIGPDYVDMGMVQNSPKMWDAIIERLAEAVASLRDEKKLKIDRITGGEVRDLVFSIPVANKLRIPHAIIRKEEKTHGAGGRFAGQVNAGEYVVHIADLMTVGSSADIWVSAIREEKATVEYYFVAFDRLQGGGELLEKLKPPVKLISLTQRNKEFYDTGEEHGFIKNRAELNKFNSNPEDWSKNFLRNNPDYIIKHTKIADGSIDQKKKEGLEVLTRGYPELIPELGPYVAKILKGKKVLDAVPEIGYKPKS